MAPPCAPRRHRRRRAVMNGHLCRSLTHRPKTMAPTTRWREQKIQTFEQPVPYRAHPFVPHSSDGAAPGPAPTTASTPAPVDDFSFSYSFGYTDDDTWYDDDDDSGKRLVSIFVAFAPKLRITVVVVVVAAAAVVVLVFYMRGRFRETGPLPSRVVCTTYCWTSRSMTTLLVPLHACRGLSGFPVACLHQAHLNS